MGYAGDEIIGNVTVPDMQKALNTSITNLTLLCTHPSVNKWSYYKPINDPLYGEYTDEEREEMFWRQNDGFTIPKFDSPSQAITGLINGNAEWTYNPPTNSSPKRAGDFRGYLKIQANWFLHWELVGGSNEFRRADFPAPPRYNLAQIAGHFDAFKEYRNSNGLGLYLGILAWDNTNTAYFLNYGDTYNLRSSGIDRLFVDMRDNIMPEEIKGKELNFAPVLTAYEGDPPSSGIDFETIATWKSFLRNNVVSGSVTPAHDDLYKPRGWWIFPVTPFVTTLSQTPEPEHPIFEDNIVEWIFNNTQTKVDPTKNDNGITTGWNVYILGTLKVDTDKYGKPINFKVDFEAHLAEGGTASSGDLTIYTQQGYPVNNAVPIPIPTDNTPRVIHLNKATGENPQKVVIVVKVYAADYTTGGNGTTIAYAKKEYTKTINL